MVNEVEFPSHVHTNRMNQKWKQLEKKKTVKRLSSLTYVRIYIDVYIYICLHIYACMHVNMVYQFEIQHLANAPKTCRDSEEVLPKMDVLICLYFTANIFVFFYCKTREPTNNCTWHSHCSFTNFLCILPHKRGTHLHLC